MIQGMVVALFILDFLLENPHSGFTEKRLSIALGGLACFIGWLEKTMRNFIRTIPWSSLVAVMTIAWFSAGCITNNRPAGGPLPQENPEPEVLNAGDMLTIDFSGVSNPPEKVQTRIKEDGTINLPLIGKVPAAGLTRGELEEEIHNRYVDRFFNRLTVNVLAENRFIYVSGEVKDPGRVIYSGDMTVLKAIAAAGDFTDFANRGNIQVTRRSGEIITVDAEEARENPQEEDIQVLPGDRIDVKRRWF